MNDFRHLAMQIDRHMQQLANEGVSQTHDILHRMVGYMPSLHKIWVGVSEEQLMALVQEFPGFDRYARLMKEAYEAESKGVISKYDGVAELSEEFRQFADDLLSMGATLERSFAVLSGMGESKILKSEAEDLNTQRQEWLSLVSEFKISLRESGVDAAAQESMEKLFGPLAERIARLAD